MRVTFDSNSRCWNSPYQRQFHGDEPSLTPSTDAEARWLYTSTQQAFANMQRNGRGPLPPPIDDIEAYWSPAEKAQAEHMLAYAVVGGPETVRAGLAAFIALTAADEVMVASMIHDHGARLRSFEIVAEVMRAL